MKKSLSLLSYILFAFSIVVQAADADVAGVEEEKGNTVVTILFFVGLIIFVIVVRKLYDKRNGVSSKNADQKGGKKKDNIYEPRYWYQCKNCKVTIRKDSMPRIEDCFKAPDHVWTELAEVGTIKYLCRNCSTLIETRTVPVVDNCPDAPLHDWEKLSN